jgi:hypothetical protein
MRKILVFLSLADKVIEDPIRKGQMERKPNPN